MKAKKIIITGGPGTGKSSIVNLLEKEGHICFPEISREVVLAGQKEGIDQLFLEKPLLFSEKLLEGRLEQYKKANKVNAEKVFLDRGIPDVVAYMDYFKTDYPNNFEQACKDFRYEKVFILPAWKEIYLSDNERYESFQEAEAISSYLYTTYTRFGYQPLEVPKASVAERAHFILSEI